MARANPRASSLAMNSRLFWPRTVPVNTQYCRSKKHPEWTMTVTRNSRCRSVKPWSRKADTRLMLTLSKALLGGIRASQELLHSARTRPGTTTATARGDHVDAEAGLRATGGVSAAV